MKRKLTTIFVSDVVGFSKMMGDDEVKTLKLLNDRRKIIDQIIDDHDGIIFGSAGDSVIAEFISPIKAAEAALETQLKMRTLNDNNPKEDQMIFRIGINIGDVMISEDNLFGDAVNIAARLEAVAKPSGICISKTVFDIINRKIKVSFENAGNLDLKNIDIPIEAFHLIESRGSQRFTNDANEVRVKVKTTAPGSIAVMLFKNLSNDVEQEYFCEGFSEDLLIVLSRFNKLMVISSNSSFAYRDKVKSLSEIGSELGVQYIIKGSVRKLGNKIRINAQLLSSEHANTLWSNNYDLSVDEVFDVQDQISEQIVSTIIGRVEADTINKLKTKRPENMGAYELVLQGLEYHRKGGVIKQYSIDAVKYFEKAIEADPSYARAHAWRACSLANLSDWSDEDLGPDVISKIMSAVELALELDPNDAEANRIMGSIKLAIKKDYDMAKYHIQKARDLCPSDVYLIEKYASILIWHGENEKALSEIQRAMRIDPFCQDILFQDEGICNYWLENYDSALESLSKVKVANNNNLFYTAATYSKLDKMDKASEKLNQAKTAANFGINSFIKSQLYKNDMAKTDLKNTLQLIPN